MITLLMGMMLQSGRQIEVYFQEGPGRSVLGWIFLGLVAGWLAGKIARGRGFGCIGDILLGLIGSVIGGWIFTKLGIAHENRFLLSLAAATVGAVVLVAIAHLFFGGRER